MLNTPQIPDLTTLSKATVLVIGDHDSGKTTFLKHFCKESIDKKLNKSSSKINIYLKRQLIERTNSSNGELSYMKCAIEFIEICGEKPYKDAMSFYVSKLLLLCSSILFFFDLTNKKSLFNFYMWMKFLIEAWEDNNDGHPLWRKPVLICAAKKNLINDIDLVKSQIDDYFNNLFGCALGGNIIYLGKESNTIDLNELYFESFLKQLCIELELNKINKKTDNGNTEDNVIKMDLTMMKGDLTKYYLNKEMILKNLFVNTFARETLANLYWQFVNQIWGYYKNFQPFWWKLEEKTKAK